MKGKNTISNFEIVHHTQLICVQFLLETVSISPTLTANLSIPLTLLVYLSNINSSQGHVGDLWLLHTG